MTAEVPELDWTLLKRITARVTAEVPGICRVCHDLTPKPVGSVEVHLLEPNAARRARSEPKATDSKP